MVDNMIDDKDKHIVDQVHGWELPVLLLGAFRAVVDRAHEGLAEQGYADARPLHGFALQAVGEGASVADVGRRLGVTKQAAARTVRLLEEQGYVGRSADPADGRRQVVVPTDHGRGLLAASADAFAEVLAQWAGVLGADAVARLAADLRRVGGGSLRLDLGTWVH